MRRRRIAEQPVSRFALWARRLALFALTVALIAVVITRLDFVEAVPGLATLGGGLIFASLAMLLAIGAFIVIWRQGLKGLGHALLAVLIGVALIAYPAFIVARGYRLPPLSDITTNPTDPPRFEAIARLRPREANPVAYAGPSAAEVQRAIYPDIEPLQTSSTPQEVYEAALAVISKRKWRVVDARGPQAGRREGRIEAVARTALMGFRDDVVVRIRPVAGGARLDLRSASRYGTRDFGANARRIRSLVEDIEEAVGSQPPARR